MRVVSINIGQPRPVTWGGQSFLTSIFKEPVTGPLQLEGINFNGDEQADRLVHGGPDKAVYAYDAAHYTFWRGQLPARAYWPPGLFGENLTTEGLLERDVRVGDLFQVGTARLRAVQPRQPCFKLNARFEDAGMVRRFLAAGRSGIYFRIEAPGLVQAGDALALLEAADTDVTIQEVADVLFTGQATPARRAVLRELPYLPVGLRQRLGA